MSEKVVRRLMKEEHLVVRNIRRRRYNSYLGEISPAVPNLIARNFHAEKPNEKWLTDITEFSIPAGKIYLSPIIDCFDGMAVSWAIGTSPNARLANSMLDAAISQLQEGEHPILHSDRGGHYRWPGWIQRTKAAGLRRSMSAKGCSPDNAACEGFFGRLKNEMFYGVSWEGVTLRQFISILDSYLHWYNRKRIKQSLGWRSRWTSDAAWAWLLDLFFYDLFWSSFLSAAPTTSALSAWTSPSFRSSNVSRSVIGLVQGAGVPAHDGDVPLGVGDVVELRRRSSYIWS